MEILGPKYRRSMYPNMENELCGMRLAENFLILRGELKTCSASLVGSHEEL